MRTGDLYLGTVQSDERIPREEREWDGDGRISAPRAKFYMLGSLEVEGRT